MYLVSTASYLWCWTEEQQLKQLAYYETGARVNKGVRQWTHKTGAIKPVRTIN